MAKVNKVLEYPVEKVWEVISDRSGKFRNDIQEIKIKDGIYTERTFDGQWTKYEELVREAPHHYQVHITNRKTDIIFTAHLKALSPNQTEVQLEQEEDKEKKMWLFSAFFVDSEKMLLRYLYEIQKILESLV
ncbi:MAG: hypothetical protein Q4P28_04970 [Tissierellia bacterium]|nr:hypothetical protein [Tissierellia bacterium]